MLSALSVFRQEEDFNIYCPFEIQGQCVTLVGVIHFHVCKIKEDKLFLKFHHPLISTDMESQKVSLKTGKKNGYEILKLRYKVIQLTTGHCRIIPENIRSAQSGTKRSLLAVFEKGSCVTAGRVHAGCLFKIHNQIHRPIAQKHIYALTKSLQILNFVYSASKIK